MNEEPIDLSHTFVPDGGVYTSRPSADVELHRLREMVSELQTEIHNAYFDLFQIIGLDRSSDGTLKTIVRLVKDKADFMRSMNLELNAQLHELRTEKIVDLARDQIIILNDWLAEHEPDIYHNDSSTAQAMIEAVEKYKRRVAELEAELAELKAARDKRSIRETAGTR